MSLPEGPGWEWNPGQTFVTAFNNAQENQRLQQKRAEEAELAAILLPAKRAEAEFNIKKLALDSQLIEKIYKTRSAALDESYRGVNQAVTSGGVQDSQDSKTKANSFMIDTTGLNLKTITSRAPSSPGKVKLPE